MINYRSINDLNQVIVKNLFKLPRDIKVVAGIPRSGLLAANILALHLNLPLTDIEGLLEDRVFKSGNRLKNENGQYSHLPGETILIVDDSVYTGETMQKIKKQVSAAYFGEEIKFLAAFVSPNGKNEVDIYFEEIKGERIFEWNIMNSWTIKNSCVDIDGVLCKDPTDEENDDGVKYENFILNATPFKLPSVKVGYLVTCRLEKYRSLTEQWLKKMGVQYNELIMLELPSKEARQKSNMHALFKGRVYKSTNAKLFIESSYRQAKEIAKIAKLPVLCIECQKMIYPSISAYTINKIIRNPTSISNRFESLLNIAKRKLFHIDPPSRII